MDIKQWLEETVAGDIMFRDVTTLHPKETLGAAADLLAAEQITGAPVVDEEGTVVGVFSTTDLLLAEKKVEQLREG